MRLFPIHILIKDCSYLLLYFIILRFNLTGETFQPDMVRYFPAAPNLTFSEIIGATLFYNIIPLLVSLVTYFIIYFIIHKMFIRTTTLSLIITALILTMTTPIVYKINGGFNPFQYRASILSLLLTFVISIISYYLFNKKDINKLGISN